MHAFRFKKSLAILLGVALFQGCGSGTPPATPEAQQPAPSVPEVKVESGESAMIPESFPKDVPLYDTMKVQSFSELAGDQSYVVQGTTPDAFEQVDMAIKAKAEANGWRESTQGGTVRDTTMSVRNYTKEKRTLNVTLFQQDAETVINLSTGGA